MLTIVLIFFFSYNRIFRKGDSHKFPGIISTIPVLTSVFTVFSICLVLSFSNIFDINHPANISFLNINTNLIRSSIPVFTWGVPLFSFPFFVAILIAYFVSTFESIGDYNAVAEISDFKEKEQVSGENRISDKRVNRGIIFEGIGCFISGIIGANPTTSYSENIGLIGITRVASRYVIFVTGLLLIILGTIPIFGTFLSTIPSPIMGGLYCVLFGMITGVGIKITSQSDLSKMRNVSIIGFTLFMAFSVPEYINSDETRNILNEIFSKFIVDSLVGIFGSNMAVASIFGLLLDNIIPNKR